MPSVYCVLYPIIHGSIVARSPRLTDLNLAVRLISPVLGVPEGWDGVCHSLSAHKSEFGVSGLPLGRSAPKAWLTRPNEWGTRLVRLRSFQLQLHFGDGGGPHLKIVQGYSA